MKQDTGDFGCNRVGHISAGWMGEFERKQEVNAPEANLED